MTEKKPSTKKNTRDLHRILVAAIALLMAAMMLLPLVADVFVYSYAVTQADIDAAEASVASLQQQKADLARQQAAAQETLNELAEQENSAMDRLNALDEKIGLVADQINTTQEIIDEYSVMIADTQEKLAQAKTDEAAYYEKFLERVRSMEEQGTVSYWEILFQSASFSDLLDRVSFVSDVMQYDNDVMDNLEAARQAVSDTEAQLETEQAAQEEAKAQMEEEQAQLEEAAEEQEQVLQEILNNKELYAAEIQSLSTQQEDLVGEISAAEQELAAKKAQKALEEQRAREEAERRAREEAERQRREEEERQRQEEAARLQAEQEAAQQQAEQEAAQQQQQQETSDSDPVQEETVDEPVTEDTTEETPAVDTSEPDTSDDEPEEDTSSSVTVDTSSKNPSASVSGSSILSYASQFVGNPYVWGGNSLTNGIDCSGFVHAVLSHFGISSPRHSASFRSFGKAVSVDNMQVGDIVCYSGHVGIYAGGGLLLSALGANYGITYCSVYYKPILAVRRA